MARRKTIKDAEVCKNSEVEQQTKYLGHPLTVSYAPA
jgi:hypothetical protein